MNRPVALVHTEKGLQVQEVSAGQELSDRELLDALVESNQSIICMLKKQQMNSPILNLEEVKDLTKKKTDRAAKKWCVERKVPTCGPKRYPRHRVLRALEREAGLR